MNVPAGNLVYLPDQSELIERARDLAAALVVAIRAGLHDEDIIDRGYFGQGLRGLAEELLEKLIQCAGDDAAAA